MSALTFGERAVRTATGITDVDKLNAVLRRMYDYQGGLGHMTSKEFAAAARLAASALFPKEVA